MDFNGVTELLTGTDVRENIALIGDVDMTEPENEVLYGWALETFPRVSTMWLQGCEIGGLLCFTTLYKPTVVSKYS